MHAIDDIQRLGQDRDCGQHQPIPPRFRWLKRLSIASGLLLIGLVVLRLWWGHAAQRRLQAAIDRYHAAGQPVLAADFDAILDAVPDDQNAAVLYEKAIDKIVAMSKSGVHFTEFFYDATTTLEKDRAAADELMRKNAEVFKLVHEARARPQVAWSERLEGFFSRLTTLYPSQRSLSKLLSFAA